MPKRRRIQIREAAKAEGRAQKAARANLATRTELDGDTVDDCVAALTEALQSSHPTTPTTSNDSILQENSTTESDPDPFSASIPKVCSGRIPVALQNDKILTWNKLADIWLKTGTYNTALLPPIEVEVARHFKVQALSSFLLESCETIKIPAFERWLLDSRLDSTSTFVDPVLSAANYTSPASQRLIEEIMESGTTLNRKRVTRIVRDLCDRSVVAVRELTDMTSQQHTTTGPFRKGDRMDLEKPTASNNKSTVLWTLVFHRKRWKKPFCARIRPDHYHKLHTLFFRIHRQLPEKQQQHPRLMHLFHLILLILLTRYSSLAGGQLLMDMRGGGMQGAIHTAAFGVLERYFAGDAVMFYEGFGSPMNCTWSSFGSAFAQDLDWHFGALGNFLQLQFRRGVVEANPPFSPGLMERMADHIDECLARTTESLTFVVIVPDAGDPSHSDRAVVKKFGGQSLTKMLTSRFRRHHILLRAKEHGYVEGAQYMRSTRYKESLYDTSVVILQSKAAEQEFDLDGLEAELRSAFASRHREEVESRKKQREYAEE